jgi:hypothetical protein
MNEASPPRVNATGSSPHHPRPVKEQMVATTQKIPEPPDIPEPPRGSVVIDGEGDAWQRGPSGLSRERWYLAGHKPGVTHSFSELADFFGPLTVVYTPGSAAPAAPPPPPLAEDAALIAEINAHPRSALIEALADAMHSIEDDDGNGRHISYYRSLAFATVEVLPALSYDEDQLCDEPGCGAHRRPTYIEVPPALAVYLLEEVDPAHSGSWRRWEDTAYPSVDAARAELEDIAGALLWSDDLYARQPGGPLSWRISELTLAGTTGGA